MTVGWYRGCGGRLINFNLQIYPDRKVLLFGIVDQSSSSVENFVILTTKYYIWITRCQNGDLNCIAYKKFLKSKLEDLKNACIFEDKSCNFEKWLTVYDSL